MTQRRKPTPTYPVPSTIELKTARMDAKLTQEEAAEVVKVTRRAWQAWENGITPVPPGLWVLFQLKTNSAQS